MHYMFSLYDKIVIENMKNRKMNQKNSGVDNCRLKHNVVIYVT